MLASRPLLLAFSTWPLKLAMASTTFKLLLIAALLTLGDAGPSSKAQRRRQRARGKTKNCRIPGCKRCNLEDREKCDQCRPTYGLTEAKLCSPCGANCEKCDDAGPGSCDVCRKGFTLDKISNECRPCADHCLKCDEAGPGGCNECGHKRMLHVRLEVTGEIHECLPCGSGCAECTEELGCTECEAFHHMVSDNGHDGCAFSYLKIFGLLAIILVPIIGCVFMIVEDDLTTAQHHVRQRQVADRAEAVCKREQSEGQMLQKRGRASIFRPEARPDTSPPRMGREYSGSSPHHSMAGYSGIEIVEATTGGRDR